MNADMAKPSPRRFRNYLPLLKELVKRDMKIKYRRSFLGYLWSLLNPLLMMCVLSFVFSTMFESAVANFPLYLICGQTLWNFFNEATNMAMFGIIHNGSLIKKVYVPKMIFPLSRVMTSFVTMSFSLIAIVIVMLFTRATIYWTVLLFWAPLVLLFVFSCGIGMALSALSVYFRDITHLYGVFTLAWMYATPIFYDASVLPEMVRNVLAWNPMYYYIQCFRQLILYGGIPGWNIWAVCIGSSLAALGLGVVVFNRLQKKFILYI